MRAAVQEGAAAYGAVGLDAGPDVRPVRLDGGAVVAAQDVDEPAERFGAVVRGADRVAAFGAEQGEFGEDPAGRGAA